MDVNKTELIIPNQDALDLLKNRTFVYQVPRHMLRKSLGIDRILEKKSNNFNPIPEEKK